MRIRQPFNLTTDLFLAAVLVAAMVIIQLVGERSIDNEQARFQLEEAHSVQQTHQFLIHTLTTLSNEVKGQGREFVLEQEGAREGKAQFEQGVVNHFQSFLESNLDFVQMRWIGADGKERVRIERRGDRVVQVPEAELQDKSNRYYTQQVLLLAPEALYLSRIDLNVEHGEVVQPYQPMLRIGYRLPPAENGEDNGFLMLNVDFDSVLQQLKVSPQQRFWLVNEQGDWLVGPEAALEWGFMFDDPRTLEQRMPGALQQIRSAHGIQLEDLAGGLLSSMELDGAEFGLQPGQAAERWYLLKYREPDLYRGLLEWQYLVYLLMTILIAVLSLVIFSLLLKDRRSRRRFEQQLNRELENRASQLEALRKQLGDYAESASDWFWESDAEHRFTHFEGALEAITGLSPQWLMGKCRDQIEMSQVSQEQLAEHRQQLASRQPFKDFVYAVYKGEEEVWLSISGVPFFAEDGTFLGYHGTGRDVTAAKRQEQAREQLLRMVEEKKSFIEQVLGIIGDGIWDWDITANRVTHNQSWIDMMGLDEHYQEHTVEQFTELIHEEDREEVMQRVKACLQGEVERYQSEHRMVSPQGDVVWVSDRGQVVERDAEGKSLRMTGGVTNITRLKQYEEKLLKAGKVKDEFLASMSHELRTPLTAILGATELLLDGEANEEQHRLFKTIEVSGVNLLSLVNDILDLSKIEAGKFDINYAPYDLSRLHCQIESMFATKAKENGLWLKLEQQAEPDYQLWGDEQRVPQILLNLLSNALKFTEQGGVTVRSWIEEEMLCFAVEDTGIGMSDEALGRLFQRFEQADGTISRRFGGTGLGLHISKTLAQMMRGDIEVSSEEGKGSCFVLRLPYEESDLSADPAPCNRVPSRQALSQRFIGEVLVAEDTPELQMLERKVLESMGVTVTLAGNGEEALSLALEREFDLILMDMQMPVMDGLEATQSLRNLGRTTPVVALTANVMQKHRDQFQQAGCDEFLSKPLDKQELQRVVARYLKADQGLKVASESVIADGSNHRGGRILAIDDEEHVLQLYQILLDREWHRENRFPPDLEETFGEVDPLPETESSGEYEVDVALQGVVGVEMVKAALNSGRPYSVALIDMRMPPGIDGLETAREIRRIDPNIFIVFVTAYSDTTIEQINQVIGYGVLYLEKPFSNEPLKQIVRLLDQQWVAAQRHKRPLRLEADDGRTVVGEEDTVDDTFIDDSLRALFEERLASLKIELEQALQTTEWSALYQVAHNIKGMGGSFGYPGLTRLAAAVCDAQREEGSVGAEMSAAAATLLQEVEVVVAKISQGPE